MLLGERRHKSQLEHQQRPPPHGSHTSAINSISTHAPVGICATPNALRACFPLSPKTWLSSSLQPLATRCCSVKSGVEFTRHITFTIRLTLFRSPTAA